MRPARLIRATLLTGALALAATGCSTYTNKALPVREPLERGDAAAAEAFLVKEKPGGDGLPYLMELGLVLRYEGEYARSNETFDEAEQLIDELFTKSLSREALAFVTNDEMTAYDGEMWERALVHYYRALNYIDLSEYDEALVECRKLNQKLGLYVDEVGESTTYRTDAFAQYLTAILYEVGGEIADAWVSLRLADEAYQHYRDAYGVPPPLSLQRDLIRLAHQQGFRDDEERYRERYPDAAPMTTRELLDRGEIVLFWEEGFIPAKIQETATVPILKDADDGENKDHKNDDREHRRRHAMSLRERYYHPRPYKKQELAYLLRFALPAFPPPGPSDRSGWCELRSEDGSARSEMAENLDAIARQELDDRMGGIVLKAILRALAKYGFTAAAENNKGDVAGKLVNLITAASEKADTRSWITLPRTIQITRLVVEPGVHDLELDCYNAGGILRETVAFDSVSVGAGEVRFLSHRTF